MKFISVALCLAALLFAAPLFADSQSEESAPTPVASPAPLLKPLPLCKDLCGDDECQEMVCMGEGCPCAESSSSCPQDCP